MRYTAFVFLVGIYFVQAAQAETLEQALDRERASKFIRETQSMADGAWAAQDAAEGRRIKSLAAKIEWHDFHGKDGETWKGKFLELESGKVIVLRKNDKLIQSSMNGFHKDDQKYIRDEIKKRKEASRKKVAPMKVVTPVKKPIQAPLKK